MNAQMYVPDTYCIGDTDDGRHVDVLPLLFGQGQIGVGPPGHQTFDECWHYAHLAQAIEAARTWMDGGYEGEPQGWVRHKPSNRRRTNGDPAQEYVRP